jgi:phage-related protein
MSTVGYATVQIIPSAQNFTSLLRGQINAPVDQAGRDGGRRFGQGFSALAGPLIAAAVAGSAIAAGRFIGGAIQAAGNLEQSMGAVNQVFGSSADQMHEMARAASQSVGLSQNAYNEFAARLGSQLRNGGTAAEELAGKVDGLITVGADLSSMFGGTTVEAVDALSSALRGERDPIERYGITLTQAAIDAKAAELGFSKVGGTLSASANQAATMALIMEQAGPALGNFARESNTLQGQQQRLAATFQNGKAAIGEAFLPAATAMVGFLNRIAQPALAGVANGARVVSEAFAAAGQILGSGDYQGGFTTISEDSRIVDFLFRIREAAIGVRDTLAPLFTGLGSAAAGVVPQLLGLLGAISPVGIIFRALQPVLPILVGMLTQLAGVIGGALNTVLATLVPAIGSVVQTLAGVFVAILPTVLNLVSTLASLLGMLIPPIAGILASILPLVATLIGQLAPIFVQLVTAVVPQVIAVLAMLVQALMPVITTIAGLLVPIIQALMPVVVTVFSVITNVVTAAMGIVQGIIQIVMAAISGNWSAVWAGIQTLLAGIWATIVALVQGAIQVVWSVIQGVMATIGALWNAAWNAIASFLSGIWEQMTSSVSRAIDGVVGFFRDLPGNIVAGLGNLGRTLWSAGQDLLNGMIEGIQSVAGDLLDAVLGPVQDAVGGVMSFLGINSPSRLFRWIGENTGEGMALGLERKADRVAAASDALIPKKPEVPEPDFDPRDFPGGPAGAAAAAGGPLVGQLTIPSSGNFARDVAEVMYRLRTLQRGNK